MATSWEEFEESSEEDDDDDTSPTSPTQQEFKPSRDHQDHVASFGHATVNPEELNFKKNCTLLSMMDKDLLVEWRIKLGYMNHAVLKSVLAGSQNSPTKTNYRYFLKRLGWKPE